MVAACRKIPCAMRARTRLFVREFLHKEFYPWLTRRISKILDNVAHANIIYSCLFVDDRGINYKPHNILLRVAIWN